MAKEFYAVSLKEMDLFLRSLGFTPLTLPNTIELVYGKIIKHNGHVLSQRVFTAINPNGNSRELGEDAIRVQLVVRHERDALLIGKTQKVLRLKTWAVNLRKVINAWEEQYKVCPGCGMPMTIRNGRDGKPFWGCSTYFKTKCDGKPKEQIVPVVAPKPTTKLVPAPAKPKHLPIYKGDGVSVNNIYRIPDDKISEAQARSVDLFLKTKSNLLLESRAGGGKTSLLKHICSDRKDGEKFVYVTFNRKNANKAKKEMPRGTWSNTTHSYLGKAVRDAVRGLPDTAELGKNDIVLDEIYPTMRSPERKRVRRMMAKLTALCKNFAVKPDDIVKIANIAEKYSFEFENDQEREVVVEGVKQVLTLSLPTAKYGKIYDWDDILWWFVMLDLKPSFYDVALIDELQDFNECQLIMVQRMLDIGMRIVSVGDPFQSVYRFRGADGKAFEHLNAMLEASKNGCAKVLLPESYRNSQAVIDYVINNTVVKDIKAAPGAIEGFVDDTYSYLEILDMVVADFGK